MEIFGVLLALCVPLLIISGIGYAVYTLFQMVQRRKSGLPVHESAVVYPEHFSLFVTLVLIGFHIGLYWNGGSSRIPVLGLALFTTSLALGWLAVYWRKRTSFVLSLIGVLMVSGWGSVFRANGFVQSINSLLAFFSALLLFVYYVRTFHFTSILSILESLVLILPLSIRQFFSILFQTLRAATEKKSSHIAQWIKTLSLMLIVSLFFISILSSADPVFAEVIKTFRDELLGRVFWSIVILFIAAQFMTSRLKEQKKEAWHLRYLSERDVVTVLASVLVVGAIFLSVQYNYLFNGSRQLLVNLGLTFSEYVRKGFIEVLIATFAGGIIAYLTALKLRTTENSLMKRVTQLGVVLLLGELSLFLLSAFKRDLLYVDMYGLTRTRIVGGLFLLWLLFFLLLLAFFAFRKKFSEGRLALGLYIASILVYACLNVINVDAIVAKTAPGHHLYTDHFYVTLLSEDAGPVWEETIPALEAATQRLTAQQTLTDVERAELAGVKLAVIALQEKIEKLQSYYGPANDAEKELSTYEKNNRRWQMWNYSEWQVYRQYALATSETPDRLTHIRENITAYQEQKQLSLFQEESRLLYELKYPFIRAHLSYYPEDPMQYQVVPPFEK